MAQSGGTPCPVTSGPTQFFASEVNTHGSGTQSMLYSTYFGGGYSADPANAAIGGGIAVDDISNNPHSNVNMYFTGTTNMWGGGVQIPNNAASFPLINAWQSCLNESGAIGTGTSGCNAPGTNTDAFVAKLNPNRVGAAPTYSTFLGGANNDTGNAVAADSIGNAYVTGGTNSKDWNCTNSCVFAPSPYDAYPGCWTCSAQRCLHRQGHRRGGRHLPTRFLCLHRRQRGRSPATPSSSTRSSPRTSRARRTSSDLNVLDASQRSYGGGASDAFVALLSTTLVTSNAGDYVTYLGGSGLDQGTGIAVDVNGAAYVAGVTQSSNFPLANPYQGALIGSQNAFVTKLGASSTLVVSQSLRQSFAQSASRGNPGHFYLRHPQQWSGRGEQRALHRQCSYLGCPNYAHR